MIQKLIEKTFNVHQPEFTRTSYAWLIKALYKTGLIIGWTTVISVFVARYSISALPVLFMVQAALTISGMLLFSFIIDRFEVRWLVVGCGFSAAILLFIATFYYESSAVFFPLVLVASGIFLPQIAIFLSNFIEDFFTPVECARTFPLIESAETIGGIIGGIVLANQMAWVSGYKMIYLWVLLIFMLIAALFIFQPRSPRFYNYLYEMKIIPVRKKLSWQGIKNGAGEIKKIPFLQVLIVIFFIQWLMGNFIEFQYTKVVDEGINASNGAQHAQGLLQGLGALQIIFFSSALIVQLLLASRIMKFLGTIGGFLFHALVTFMSTLTMMLGFGYFTAVMAKNNYEVSGIVSRNAYEASYYAFRHGTQKTLREFFEGLVAPAGTIMGTILLLIIRMFFVEKDSMLAINLLLVLLAAFVIVISIKLQKGYTSMVQKNLFSADYKISRLHSIEILAQKGHGHGLEILISALRKYRDPDIVTKVIGALHQIGDIRAIPAIAECIHDPDERIAVKAIKKLADFPGIKKRPKGLIFSRKKIVDDLKSLFSETSSIEIKKAILSALASIDDEGVSFILDVLKNPEPELQAECMRYMCRFGDPAVAIYIRPYLKADDARVRARAIACLSHFKVDDESLRESINNMITSGKKDEITAMCSILGGMNQKRIRHVIEMHLGSADEEIRLHAAIGLLKAGYQPAAKILADLLLKGNPLILGKAKKMAKELRIRVKRMVAELMEKGVLKQAGIHLDENKQVPDMLEMMGNKLLKKMAEGYGILGLREEVELINTIIEYRKRMANRPINKFELITEQVTNQ